jgi:ferric-dicitrate binding protein FerR (iron transport regulator)
MDPNSPYQDADPSWELMVSALQGSLSPEEDNLFRQWLGASAANQETFDRLNQIYNEGLDDYPAYSAINEEAAWKALQLKRQKTGRAPVTRLIVRMAAAGVLLLAVFGGWWYLSLRGSATSYETARNEQRMIVLPDGSSVRLEQQTRIELPPGYNTHGRSIELVAGSAEFQVIHQPGLPFRVEMGIASVEDLGTKFTIAKTPDSISVRVIEGRVAFAAGKSNPPKQLSAGRGLTLYTMNGLVGEIRETTEIASQSLRFENAPVSTVLATLQRWSGKTIFLRDSVAAQKKMTVNLQGESLENALLVVCASAGLEYSLHNGVYLLQPKNPGKP